MRVFVGLPRQAKIAVVVLLLIVGVVALVLWVRDQRRQAAVPEVPVPPGAVVFMFWNVENLFDDQDDRRNSTDEPYDNWFARDAADRKLKYDRLAEIILKVNEGKGPDIFAGVELESRRAAELLQETLNAKLPTGSQKYEFVAMKELSGNAGRYIAPCVISRIPLDEDRTRLLGQHNLRVLETHLMANKADLCLVVSHWTSQRSDDGTRKGSGRDKYATTIYAEYERVVGNDPTADFLVCGDFNDTPDSEPVVNELHMTRNRADVTPTRTNPHLLGLLSGKPLDRFSTHYFDRDHKAFIYDQIGVSAGMLDDRGWGCDPDSVRVPTDGMTRGRARRPWRFGGPQSSPQGRGYSDHFPVVVNLKIAP